MDILKFLKIIISNVTTGYYFSVYDFNNEKKKFLFNIFWKWIEPLCLVLIFVALYNAKSFIQFNENAYPSSYFVVSGIILWQLLVDSINTPINFLNSNKNIFFLLRLPSSTIISAVFTKNFIDSIFKTVILIIFSLFVLDASLLKLIYLFVYIYFYVFIFTLIGILLSICNLILGDINVLVNVLFRPLFFISNVVIPMGFFNKEIVEFIQYNPLLIYINNGRDILFTYQPSFYYILFLILTTIFAYSLLKNFRYLFQKAVDFEKS